jgi:SulP family sulfate permease
MPEGVKRFLPVLSWLPGYDRSWLTFDAIAGLTLWGLVAPEAMAYAGIAAGRRGPRRRWDGDLG